MKKLIIGLTALICFSFYAENAEAIRKIEYHRSWGLFGLYAKVDQETLGYDFLMNEVVEINCKFPGFSKCKYRNGAGENGAEPFEDPLMDFAKSHVSQLEVDIEDDVKAGNWTGSKTLKIERTDQNSGEKFWVVITALWESFDEDFNDGSLTIIVDEVPFVY